LPVSSSRSCPPGPYAKLRRWHHLSFLKASDTLRLLERVERDALEPERVGRLVRVELTSVARRLALRARAAFRG
jgi:hypothetical protein